MSARLSAGWVEARERILQRYLELLAADLNPLLEAGPAVVRQLKGQLFSVVDAVHARLSGEAAEYLDAADESSSEAIGRSRATARIHPSQSLRAASMIFEAALPTIAAQLRASGATTPELTAGLLLNNEILQRMSAAARGYVEYLLEKVHSSHRDERRRLSRELHDVAAPSVAIALQNLELFDVYAASDSSRAADKIDGARQSLLDALATIRGLAAQSRESVAANGLAEAVRRYVDTLGPDITVDVATTGDLTSLALTYAEELFLIVREAIRNAADHARAREISVTIAARPGKVDARVTDDGSGFDAASGTGKPQVGIDAMYERAALLGADLEITSRPGKGTTVSVSVSLPANARHGREPVGDR